jgi:hypothetical protein
MKELEGKDYLKEEERSYEGYMKKFDDEMEVLEKKYEEIQKTDKVSKEDEKLIFDSPEVQEYIKSVAQDLEKEKEAIEAETQELQEKLMAEEEG